MLKPSEIASDYVIRDLDFIILTLAKKSRTWCYRIRKQISKATDVYVSATTILDHANELERYGYIQTVQEGRRGILTVTPEGEKYWLEYKKAHDKIWKLMENFSKENIEESKNTKVDS